MESRVKKYRSAVSACTSLTHRTAESNTLRGYVEAVMNNNLLLALEPEAASLYCQHIYTQRTEEGFSVTSEGTKVMVVDLGGMQQCSYFYSSNFVIRFVVYEFCVGHLSTILQALELYCNLLWFKLTSFKNLDNHI